MKLQDVMQALNNFSGQDVDILLASMGAAQWRTVAADDVHIADDGRIHFPPKYSRVSVCHTNASSVRKIKGAEAWVRHGQRVLTAFFDKLDEGIVPQNVG